MNWRAAEEVLIAMLTTIPATALLAAALVLITLPFIGR